GWSPESYASSGVPQNAGAAWDEARQHRQRLCALEERSGFCRRSGEGSGRKICDVLMDSARERQVLRSEEHTSELQSRGHLVCRLLLEKKKKVNRSGEHDD